MGWAEGGPWVEARRRQRAERYLTLAAHRGECEGGRLACAARGAVPAADGAPRIRLFWKWAASRSIKTP